MAHWLDVVACDQCPPGTCLEAVAGDVLVAVFNVDGQYFALDGVCPHQGGPLGKGALQGHIVTCPWHGWQFDVRSGQHQINSGIRQRSLPVRVVNGRIQVDITVE